MIEKTLVQIKIRMPRGLHQRLARDAARTPALTINAEIVRRLEESYRRPSDTKAQLDWDKVQKHWRVRAATFAKTYIEAIKRVEQRLDRIEGKEGKGDDKTTTIR